MAIPRAQILDLPSMFSLGFGLCLPTSCSIDRVIEVIKEKIPFAANEVQLAGTCALNENTSFNAADWVAM